MTASGKPRQFLLLVLAIFVCGCASTQDAATDSPKEPVNSILFVPGGGLHPYFISTLGAEFCDRVAPLVEDCISRVEIVPNVDKSTPETEVEILMSSGMETVLFYNVKEDDTRRESAGLNAASGLQATNPVRSSVVRRMAADVRLVNLADGSDLWSYEMRLVRDGRSGNTNDAMVHVTVSELIKTMQKASLLPDS